MSTGYTESGQIYRETVISTRQVGCTCPYRQDRNTSKLKGPKRSSPSLKSMAIRSFLNNLKLVTPESLSTVPEPILKQLWTEVKHSGCDDLYLWKCFAQSELGNENFTHSCECRCSYPDLPFLIEMATSPTMTFLTNVTICNQTIEASDTVGFTKMVNLQNCFIHRIHKAPNRPAVFNDAVMRSWATAAQEHGAFSKLETIFLSGLNDVSHFSLPHLNSFPVLQIFCVQQCDKFREKGVKVETPGWHHEDTAFKKFVDASRLRAAYTATPLGSLASSSTIESKSHKILEFNTLAENYVRSRRQKEYSNLPLLNLSFVPPKRRDGMRKDIVNFTCYERDKDAPVHRFAEDTSKVTSKQGPVLKRRKINAGKSNALHEFLESM